MSHVSHGSNGWDTASMGLPADMSSQERTALGEHLGQCGALRGPWQVVWAGADELRGLLAGRVVTSTLVVTVLTSGAWWLL